MGKFASVQNAQKDDAMPQYGRLSGIQWAILTLSVGATFLAWAFTGQLERQRVQANFDSGTRQISTMIEESLQQYAVALRSGVAAIEAQGGDYSFEDWSLFAASLDIKASLPGVNGIGVIYQVLPEELEGYLAEQRVTRPDFAIHPPHAQDIYLPITYIFPVDINREAVGLDMVFEANRHDGMDRARDTGAPQITAPIRLVQDEMQTPGFLFFAPFYSGSDMTTVEDRQKAFSGAVYAPFITRDLFYGALSRDRRTTLVRIWDGKETIYDEFQPDDPDFDPDPLARASLSLSLYGREWVVEMRSGMLFREQQQSYRPATVLGVGILIDLCMLGLFLILLRENRLGVRYARKLQREAEHQAIQASDLFNRLTAVMDAAHSGIIAMNSDGQIVLLNTSARNMLGRRHTPPPFGWPEEFSFIDGDGKDCGKDPVRRALAGQDLNGLVMAMVSSFNPKHRSFVRLSSATITNADSMSVQAVIIFDDVTEQEVNRQKMERSGRLDALGQLTGGIAHDFNNLLGVIEYSVELYSTVDDPQQKAAYKKSALSSVRRGSDLAGRLLTFAKKQPGTGKATDVSAFCADFQNLIEPTIEKSISLEFECEPDLWVFCDVAQLENGLLNLVLNARDAIIKSGQGNRVLIKIRPSQKLTPKPGRTDVTADAWTEFVEFSVTDNGPGMDADTKSRCTDPFFTTKDTQSGSGLGLSMVYGFVEQSGGELAIYSEPDLGTTIRMMLPAASRDARPRDVLHDDPLPIGKGETVLITEDEEDLLFLMANILESLGYKAIKTKNGEDALEILASSAPVDILLTDIVMPGSMGGFQVAERAREMRPNLPVLYMSGYSGFSRTEMGRVIAPILNKPSSPNELACALHVALQKVRG